MKTRYITLTEKINYNLTSQFPFLIFNENQYYLYVTLEDPHGTSPNQNFTKNKNVVKI